MVLRLLVLNHMRNWTYGVLEREVRANLVYRDFTPGGRHQGARRQDLGRWGVAVGPVVVKQIHERIVQIARDHRVAQGQSPPFFLASPWGTAAWDAPRSLGDGAVDSDNSHSSDWFGDTDRLRSRLCCKTRIWLSGM